MHGLYNKITLDGGPGDGKGKKKGKCPDCVDSVKEAFDHYFDKKDHRPMSPGEKTKQALRSSHPYKRVIKRLKSGIANKKSGTFDVDLGLGRYIFIGDTNVDYSTYCSPSICQTVFDEFVRDGFWDVKNWLEKLGVKGDGPGYKLELNDGYPYYFKPTYNSISYPNPGYGTGWIK